VHYRVEELAAASGVTVDTVRFYQGRGLIPAPQRQGRLAIYAQAHLERIRQIRALLAQGFSLAQIRRLPSPGEEAGRDGDPDSRDEAENALLLALAQESLGDRSFSRAELASEAGVPEELIRAAESAGLLEPIHGGGSLRAEASDPHLSGAHDSAERLANDGGDRFSSADVEMLRSGLAILGAGFPLADFLALATRHAENVKQVSDVGIDLFDDHVRKVASDEDDSEVVARAFRALLPQVTRLVALHFQRTLVKRAIERLRAKGDGSALESALGAVETARLEVEWRR
jgi:DNA-binding transcriptional MerR regulator